jgi:hypothetical protein
MRSFSRRVFCELSKNSRALHEVMPNKWSNVSLPISEISKRIGGILFLLDNNVETQKNFDSRNAMSFLESYLYLNPNAYKKNKNIVFTDLAHDLLSSHILNGFEDFVNDNY